MDQKGVDAVFKNFTHSCEIMKGAKRGDVYLTNYRLIFINSDKQTAFHDLNMPFHLIKDFEIQQPAFGANRLQGRILAEENAPQPMAYPIIDPMCFGPSYGTSGLAAACGAANPPVSSPRHIFSTSTANYPRMSPSPPPSYNASEATQGVPPPNNTGPPPGYQDSQRGR